MDGVSLLEILIWVSHIKKGVDNIGKSPHTDGLFLASVETKKNPRD
jgi:hypothetical protein